MFPPALFPIMPDTRTSDVGQVDVEMPKAEAAAETPKATVQVAQVGGANIGTVILGVLAFLFGVSARARRQPHAWGARDAGHALLVDPVLRSRASALVPVRRS